MCALIPTDRERRQLSLYMYELIDQYEFATIAAEAIDAASQFGSPDRNRRTFGAVQGVLAAAAMTSKILWPIPPQKHKAATPEAKWTVRRGPLLRKALRIPDSHILRSRSVRDSFEHFDNRLDRLVAHGQDRKVMDMITHDGPLEKFVEGDPDTTYMRSYRIDTADVSVLSQSVDIGQLIGAMAEIASRADAWRDER